MKEILLDTNIFARYLVGDIPSQVEKSKKIFDSVYAGEVKASVSLLVIDELLWVLEDYYGYSRANYLPKIIKLFSFNNIKVIETKKEIVIDIFELMLKTKVDFTDYYLLKVSKGREVVSFDKDFEKLLS